MYHAAATFLHKRVVEDGVLGFGGGGDGSARYELPSWTWIVILLDLILLLPLEVFVDYTLNYVYPTFAIIENENPPAYEPVALSENPEDDAIPVPAGTKPTHGRPVTVSSSLRSINRLLRAHGGFRANFRGLACLMTQGILTFILMGIFSGAFNSYFTPVATLLASLTLVQLSTAWVHIVISHPSEKHFWGRLPSFKRAFDATWKPTVLYWAAQEFTSWLPFMIASLCGFQFPSFSMGAPAEVPDVDAAYRWSLIGIFVASIISKVFIVIPAHVILVRVQASLLPEDEDAIVPFDRSFRGAVVPAVVGGTGYATIGQAWSTFSRASWRNLVILYVKIFAAMVVCVGIMMAIVVPEVVFIMKNTRKID